MKKIEIVITYNGQSFVFTDGLKAYLFHLGIERGLNINNGELLHFIDKTYDTVTIPNTTSVEDVADFIAENWETLKNYCGQRIFDRFVENKPDGFDGEELEGYEEYEDVENDEEEQNDD